MIGREIEELTFLHEIEIAMIGIEEDGYMFTSFELSLCQMIQERISEIEKRIRNFEKEMGH